jgi:hypothetical protein
MDVLRLLTARLSAVEVTWVMLIEEINVGEVTANKVPRVTELTGRESAISIHRNWFFEAPSRLVKV